MPPTPTPFTPSHITLVMIPYHVRATPSAPSLPPCKTNHARLCPVWPTFSTTLPYPSTYYHFPSLFSTNFYSSATSPAPPLPSCYCLRSPEPYFIYHLRSCAPLHQSLIFNFSCFLIYLCVALHVFPAPFQTRCIHSAPDLIFLHPKVYLRKPCNIMCALIILYVLRLSHCFSVQSVLFSQYLMCIFPALSQTLYPFPVFY
jgi:hypothetical protein